jgi:hypothetical protein
MTEIHFVVEAFPNGGFIARALGQSIFTEANDLRNLHQQVHDAVRCHFDEDKAPFYIHLHFLRDEVILVKWKKRE